MTVHLVKLCVGTETIGDLEHWVKRRTSDNAKSGQGRVHDHITRMYPRRIEDLLDGGSIYWVIKGMIKVRQKLVGFENCTGADGIKRCRFLIDPPLITTQPHPRRAFQGWRYLTTDDAPADTISGTSLGKQGPPPALNAELAALGLL